MTAPQWLVFDLGGVLMNFIGVQGLSEFAGWSEADTSKKLVESSVLREFETGQLTPTEFSERFVRELGLDVTPAEMLHRWANWEAGPMPGALEYVESLQANWRLACLSNTSITHWERLCGIHGIDTLFERRFTSFEIGLHKPDPKIFAHVADALGVAPGAITYFDDRHDIVSSANRYGFQAYQVCSPREVAAVVQTLEPTPLTAG